MNPELTPRQESFLRYLTRWIARTGKAPSLRQAASENGVSHAAVAQLIRVLEKKGAIKRAGRYGRVIHLLSRSAGIGDVMRLREVPIVGTIAAGLPLYAQQEWDGTVIVDAQVYKSSLLFALKIKGDSMKDAAILNGDLVICEPRQFAQNGEIVAVLIRQEEATVKRFFRQKNHIELKPENPAYQPMRYAFDEILIQGKVIGVCRGPEGIK